MLWTAPAAEGACSEASTRWPLLAARTAVSAVTGSRISPIMITSGDWRSTLRSNSGNPTSALGLICDCRSPATAYSIGSSMVLIFRSPLFRCLRQPYRVVVLPDPVGPLTRIRPLGMASIAVSSLISLRIMPSWSSIICCEL